MLMEQLTFSTATDSLNLGTESVNFMFVNIISMQLLEAELCIENLIYKGINLFMIYYIQSSYP